MLDVATAQREAEMFVGDSTFCPVVFSSGTFELFCLVKLIKLIVCLKLNAPESVSKTLLDKTVQHLQDHRRSRLQSSAPHELEHLDFILNHLRTLVSENLNVFFFFYSEVIYEKNHRKIFSHFC